jgi:hypothetical protein
MSDIDHRTGRRFALPGLRRDAPFFAFRLGAAFVSGRMPSVSDSAIPDIITSGPN